MRSGLQFVPRSASGLALLLLLGCSDDEKAPIVIYEGGPSTGPLALVTSSPLELARTGAASATTTKNTRMPSPSMPLRRCRYCAQTRFHAASRRHRAS